MSGIPSRPPPTPNGVAAAPKVGSCGPRAPTAGEPMSRPEEPFGPIAAHDAGLGSPACAQVIGMMWLITVPSPGNDSSVLAMLPVGPSAKNCGVSAQVLFVFSALLRRVSYEKKTKRWFLMIGPPTL